MVNLMVHNIQFKNHAELPLHGQQILLLIAEQQSQRQTRSEAKYLGFTNVI